MADYIGQLSCVAYIVNLLGLDIRIPKMSIAFGLEEATRVRGYWRLNSHSHLVSCPAENVEDHPYHFDNDASQVCR
jgi:hypothetical protein